jgi:5'-nucleotidase/UDP-sugar diphosphatase
LELAKLINPGAGVDLIIGGHSHTILKEPAKVNNILVVQAGVGSDHIGRLDIEVDDGTNSIIKYTWRLIPIDNNLAEPDVKLQKFISHFQEEVDNKYNAIIGKLAVALTHPKREVETSLGNLVADAFAERAQCDVALVGSGSIRSKEIGPVITLKDLCTCFPYDDSLSRYSVSGLGLKTIFCHIMRPENLNSEGECYQVNSGVRVIYDITSRQFLSLKINEVEVAKDGIYTICLQGYHFKNSLTNLNLSQEQLTAVYKAKLISTSAQDVLVEYIRNNQNLKRQVEGRLTYLKNP